MKSDRRSPLSWANQDYWIVVTIRDGKICRDEWFADRAEALEAAGLSE
jgi:ketosteroid isomerase-like protein